MENMKIGRMSFNVKCVRDCLVMKGRVFSVRKWEGMDVESKVMVEGVGMCNKYRIRRVDGKESIARYVRLSGFKDVELWWNVIARFGACNGWLFLIVKEVA